MKRNRTPNSKPSTRKNPVLASSKKASAKRPRTLGSRAITRSAPRLSANHNEILVCR